MLLWLRLILISNYKFHIHRARKFARVCGYLADSSTQRGPLYEVRVNAVDADVQHRRQLSENNELHLGGGYRATRDALDALGGRLDRIDQAPHPRWAPPGERPIRPSTAFAVLQANATPVFADVDRDTFQISAASIAERITPRTKAIITVTADNKNKKYGEAIPQLTAQLDGFVNGETLENSGITGTPKLSTTATDSSDLGTYPIVVEKGSLSADNYDFTSVAGELFVGKGLIQVKANNVTRVYGQDNPVFTATYSGFVNGDNINSGVITGAPKVYSNTNKFTGSYTFPIFVELGTLASSKYDFDLVNGELYVAQAPITVKATLCGARFSRR